MVEIDFEAVVNGAMSAFRSRLLCWQIEHDSMPPEREYELAVWSALGTVVNAVYPDQEDTRFHFGVKVESLGADNLVAVSIEPRSDIGVDILNLMNSVGARFT